MAFSCRTNQSRLKHLTHQFKRYYIQVPSLNHSISHTKICEAKKPFWESAVKTPNDFCNNVRFFAAPVQAQQKKDEKETSGPRLNDKINAQFVRLVLDEGHKVVSRHEALALARSLQCDLVEVDRKANPPVCKIMDFHKEKYQKELKEKDRAKAKSDITLKKGDCKEVRFSGKIEQKDLQMKADTVKRLMDKGYRVKCMALPVGKKEETEDLGGYLSRLIDLIEDISVVESGPHVERKQAYAIIRHVKFGPSKKGGLKKLKAVGDTSGVSKAATPSSAIERSVDIPTPAIHEEDPVEFGLEKIEKKNTPWSVSNSNDDLNEVFDLADEAEGLTSNFTPKVMNAAPESASPPASISASNFSHPKPVPNFSRADTLGSTPHGPSLGTGNRYARSEQKNQFPQKPIDNLGSGTRESFRSEPQFPSQRRQPPPPPNMNASPSMGEKKPIGTEASNFRNSRLPNSISSDVPNTRASSYGIFSNPTANAPTGQGMAADRTKEGIPTQGTAGVRPNQSSPGLKSDGSQTPGPDNGQRKFGIFSR